MSKESIEDEISFLSEESKYLQGCITRQCDELEDLAKRLGSVLMKLSDLETKKAVKLTLHDLAL